MPTSTITKTKAGFLYKEAFGVPHAMWQVDPLLTNKVRVNQYSFELIPGDEVVRYMTETPAREFVMQANFTHRPVTYNNFAGITVLCDKDAYIECTTFRDQNTESGGIISYYTWIKVIKKDFRYTFYGSTDGNTWILIGSSLSRGTLIGFFLKCPDISENAFRIQSIEFHASNFITIYGVKSFYQVFLYNAAGNLVLEKEMPYGATQCDIDTTQFKLPMTDYRFKITNSDNEVIFNEVVTLNGGDVYEISPVEVYAYLDRDMSNNYEGLLLNNQDNNEFDIGRLEDVYTYHTITLLTEPESTAYDTNIYIQPFLYNSHVADLVWLALAEDNEELPEDISEERWLRRINIHAISDIEPVTIFMRIQKDFTQVMLFDTTRYKFKIILE